MVGALWIDSGSDSDSDGAQGSRHRHRRSPHVDAVAAPSRHDVPPPSSSTSVIVLSSSQDHPQHTIVEQTGRKVARVGTDQQAVVELANLTPGQRMAQLLAEPSPDTSLPTFRGLLQQHALRSAAVHPRPSATSTLDASADVAAPLTSRVAPISSRAGSLRRTASQPVATSSQDDPTSSLPSLRVRRSVRTAAIPEVIEIGSDSIVDPVSEADPPFVLQTSSPIRSQLSARPHLCSSQPLPFSPPRAAGPNPQKGDESKMLRSRHGRQAYRTESEPIVILSSSPPPVPFLPTSQRSLTDAIAEVAENALDLPDLPPSSFPFADPPLSPPSSPLGAHRAVNASPTLKRRAADSTTQLALPKRSRGLNRTTSLLEALDELYTPADTAMPEQARAIPSNGNGGEGGSPRAAANKAASAPHSPSKAQKSAAAKEAREAKAREREAAKATRLRAAAEKKRFLEVNRLRTSKSDTMRELIVDLDRSLFAPSHPLAHCYDSIKTRFEQEGASVELYDSVIAPPLVRFRRKVKAAWNAEKRHWVPLDAEEVRREGMVIVYVDAKQVVEQVQDGGEAGLERWYGDLKRWVEVGNEGQAEEHSHLQVFLICQGLVKYYSRLRANENRAYTARIRQQLAENQSDVSQAATAPPKSAVRPKATVATTGDAGVRADHPPQSAVERGLLQLKLVHRCYVIHAASLVDGIEWLHQLASDLSLKPYKSLRDTHLSFAVDTGRHTTSASSAHIYTTMLQQIPRVTPAIANSITTIYPSLQMLLQAYQRCTDEKEQQRLLSGVQVQSNKDGTERRGNRMNLGLQLSKRIHAVLRGSNGDLLINNPTKD